MLPLIKSKIWSSFPSRYLLNISSNNHSWLKAECIEFHDKIQLKNPASSNLLLKLFTNPESYKLISQNIYEKINYLDKIIKHAEERDRIEEVCLFLTEKFNSRFLTFNRIQYNFPDEFRFYWNHHILQAYADALDSRAEQIFITGPKNLGKSFNLALLRNILLSNVTEDRIIYIHNPEDLFNTKVPFKWLLDDLQFTFAHELKNKDPNVYKAFGHCYNVVDETENTQIKSLEDLLSLSQNGGKKLKLLIDQQYVLNKYNMIATHRSDSPWRLATYQAAEKLIRTIIQPNCKKVMTVASLTNEGYDKQNQEVKSVILDPSLPEEMSKIFIRNLFKERMLTSEEISTILELTQGIPGEISRIIDAEGEKVNQKILNYLANRSKEIQSDFAAFLANHLKRNIEVYNLASEEMRTFSAYIDTDVQLEKIPMSLLYDARYIRVEDLKVYSLFPAVSRALREAFSAQDIYVRMMNEQYQKGDMTMVGKLYDRFMKDAFIKTASKPINMNIQGTEPNTTGIMGTFKFAHLKKEYFVSVDQIDLNKIVSNTVYVPVSEYFKDIDIIIYLPNDKILLVMNFEYREGLHYKWVSFCAGDQAILNSEKSSFEKSKVSAVKDLRLPFEEKELNDFTLSPKDELVEKFKGQVADVKIMFVFGFIKSEYDAESRKKIIEQLGSGVYLWHSVEIEDLTSLKFGDENLLTNTMKEQSLSKAVKAGKTEKPKRGRPPKNAEQAA